LDAISKSENHPNNRYLLANKSMLISRLEKKIGRTALYDYLTDIEIHRAILRKEGII